MEVKNIRKRVALTVYTTDKIAEELNRGFARAVLGGFNGSRQEYINKLLNDALAAEKRR